MAHDATTLSLIGDLVIANHILYAQGVVDAMGHVSVRSPGSTDRFLLARGVAPSVVTADDILELDLAGEAVGANTGKPYLERFIHCEIYRLRPEVAAVVHSHSPSVIPFGVTPTPLRPIFHMSSFLGDGAPIFDSHDVAGDTDLLIRTPALGVALAQSLGDCSVVLQRGHGSTVCGRCLREAVFRAVYLEVNARLQAEAMRLGPITFLTPGEAVLATATNAGPGVERCWALWAHEAEARQASGKHR